VEGASGTGIRAFLSILSASIAGEPGIWGGGSYTGDFDRRMTEGYSGEASLCKGFHKGDLGGGLLYRGT